MYIITYIYFSFFCLISCYTYLLPTIQEHTSKESTEKLSPENEPTEDLAVIEDEEELSSTGDTPAENAQRVHS